MPIKLQVSTSDTVKYMASLALKHRLYVSGWCMSYSLKRARDLQSFREKSVVVIALSTETNTPVGAAIVCRKDIDVFVRKSERNKGIGKELVNAVTKAVGRETEIFVATGSKGSSEFFKKAFSAAGRSYISY